jgi:hypothetical protein
VHVGCPKFAGSLVVACWELEIPYIVSIRDSNSGSIDWNAWIGRNEFSYNFLVTLLDLIYNQ